MNIFDDLTWLDEEKFQKRFNEFGLLELDRFLEYLPEVSRHMRRKITYGHRDFERIFTALAKGEDWAVVSELNPSGPLHFGHKTIFDEALWL